MIKVGRPTKFNSSRIEQVKSFSSIGLTIPEIAKLMKVSPRTISGWMETNEDFLQARKKGMEISDQRVVESLYKQALKGNVIACIFWLKNRQPDKWRDVNKGDVPSTQPIYIINHIPGMETNASSDSAGKNRFSPN